MLKINRAALRDGMIAHMASGNAIAKAISKFCRGWSHDACIRQKAPGVWVTQDATWPKSREIPIEELETEMNLAKSPTRLEILWITDALPEEGQQAVLLFKAGVLYDVSVYLRVLVGMVWPSAASAVANWTFAKWCTEQVRSQWMKWRDPWKNEWATPGDTQTCVDQGKIQVVTDAIVTQMAGRMKLQPLYWTRKAARLVGLWITSRARWLTGQKQKG